MEGRRHRQKAGLKALLRTGLERPGHNIRWPRQNNLARSVIVREHKVRTELCQYAADIFRCSLHRHHRTGTRLRRFRHQGAAFSRCSQRAGCVHRAGIVQRHDLAEAVPGGHVGANACLVEQRKLGKCNGSNRRLGMFHRLQPVCLVSMLNLIEGGGREGKPVQLQSGGTLVAGGIVPYLASGREGHREVGTHADILAALSGEHEGNLAVRRRIERYAATCFQRPLPDFAAPDRIGRIRTLGRKVRRRLSHNSGTCRRRRIEILMRCRSVGSKGGFRHVRKSGLDPLRKRFRRVRRKKKQLCRKRAPGLYGITAGILFQRDVEVAAAEPEGTDRCTAWSTGRRHPGTRLGIQIKDRACLDRFSRLLNLDGWREHFAAECVNHLDETGRSRGSFRVPHLRLHRTDGTPGFVRGILAENKMQSFNFCLVAGLGTSPVRLDEIDCRRIVSGLFISPFQRTRLSARQRAVDRGALAVGSPAKATDNGMDRVSITFGIFQTSQGDHADTFTEHGTVGAVRKWPAIPGLRQGGRLRETHEHQDVVQRIRATGQHRVAVTGAQLMHSDLQRSETRSACGIGHVIAARQVEAIGNPPGDHVAEQAWEGRFLPLDIMVLDPLRDVLHLALGETGLPHGVHPSRALQTASHMCGQFGRRSDTEDDAGSGLVDLALRIPLDVFQRHLGRDQRQQLRRIRTLHRFRRNAEMERVESERADEATASAIGMVLRAGVFIIVIVHQPMAGWHISDQVAALEQIAPEARDISASRKYGTHSDHGNRAGVRLRHHAASVSANCWGV